ncbi:MAG: hypothetical protein JNM22_07585 [Saprospiraceae bacterium]|nr:hypothetical protein [Saprospiraceae bacterium]
MYHSPALKRTLSSQHPLGFVAVAGLIAFVAYGCVYAFRKPFTAAGFEGLAVWGVQYKIALVIAQVAGYALSKFAGIRLISSLGSRHRTGMLLGILAVAVLSLLGFANASLHWGVFWMFLNGIPLGMAWGVVFSYLEGRRVTEALAALLCINFIVSSGFVKTVGKWLVQNRSVSEFSMPLLTGLLFLPALLLCIWLLEHLPPPTDADKAQRNERASMSAADRKALFRKYAPGLLLLTGIYLILTIIRDVRDNFAVDIWKELGYGNQPAILTTSELPIALLVLLSIGAMSWVADNFRALRLNHAIIIGGAALTIGSTVLFQQHLLPPVAWIVSSGTGIFLSYILFNGVLFDRLMAAFREKGNAGFLIYLADAVGYLGSVLVLLWRNFGQNGLNWVDFFCDLCLYGSGAIIIMALLSIVYFRKSIHSFKANQDT